MRMSKPYQNNRPCIRHFLAAGLAVLLLALAAGAAFAADNPWAEAAESAIPATGMRTIQPVAYRTVAADFEELGRILAQAPMEGTAAAESAPLALDLPLPDGSTSTFRVVETPLMHPDLGAQFPEIRTYVARMVEAPGVTARLDRTPHGFHAMVFLPAGTAYIDPYQQGDVTHYQSYWRKDFSAGDRGLGCEVLDEAGTADELRAILAGGGAADAHGTQLRTYRCAIATTGEYTIFHGGTVPLGLAAVVTALNRVTGIYENEVSVRMQLIANNSLIIYTNPSTDPYDNNNGSTMLSQNQSNLDAVIGTANYDIGHVFSTGGGGIASLGVVCRAGLKARGVTGLPSPIGDPFYVDYVAHEMGHQYAANHTFNGTAGSCAGGNRNAGTAYEPGSGSTIMAYAGICGNQNLQPLSDDYFHWISIQEIVNYTTFGAGNGCAAVTATGATIPTVTAPAGGFSIPISTPFSLTGSATTVGTATYCWEESDLGPAGSPTTPSGNAPIFRTWDPTSSPTRVFPRLQSILSNGSVIGELLPTYARNLSFKMTVRDRQAGGVGVDNASIAFLVEGTAGPFTITYPNVFNLSFAGGSSITVTWNVANTNLPPINTQLVNILLSTDGGNNFTTTLAGNTANDGSESIVLPNLQTTTARIKIEPVGHIYFDINNFNFTIQQTTAVDDPVAMAGAGTPVLHECRPNPFNPATAIVFELPAAGEATLHVYDLSGRLVTTLVAGPLAAGRHEVAWNGTDARGAPVASGIYLCELRAAGVSRTQRMTLLK
jgi:hypothetical protein